MRRISGTAVLPASPAEVYAFIADPANVPRWQSNVIASERTSPAPTVTGSTGRIVFEVMGQRVTADTTIREAVQDRRMVIASSVSGMSVVGSLDLAPADGGTRVTYSSEIKAESIWMAPLERMVADVAEKDLAPSLERLKAALQATSEGGL
jgi:carbon monoxide dehydrogenase subunit G